MKIYKPVSLVLMLLFVITGVLFLAIPDKVLIFFNNISSSFGIEASPVIGWNFYLVLTGGYMYLVSVLAFMMYRHPDNRSFPLLLAHAKLASSVLSLAFFLLHAHYLVYLANFIIDGAIGIIVLILRSRVR